MRYTTEFKPEISQECKYYILNNINPEHDNTKIYYLDIVIQEINDQSTFNISKKDLKTLNALCDENVTYIEF